MNEEISREAIESMMDAAIDEWRGEMDNAIKRVLENHRWIPVSERLPEKDGQYLVTTTNGDIARYVFNKNGNSLEYWRRCAIAWMPLPEPYKVEPQESDHKCHTCKHYTSGEHDGSCGSYICKGYSNWESEDKE